MSDESLMKVALVAAGLPLGGSTTFILFLATGLKSIGVEVEVFSFTFSNPLAEDFSSTGIRVHTCNERQDIYEDRLQSLYRELRMFDPTVVVSVLGVESYEMLRYLPAGVLRVGVILDMAIRPQVFVPRYSHTIDHVVVIAHYLVNEIMHAKKHPSVTYVQLGIPIPKNVAPRKRNLNSPLRLIYYGRLEENGKGVRIFPEIASALKERNVRYTWTIQGTGSEENYLRHALAAEMREGTVRFSAPVPHEVLPSVVRAHDIYILTSTNEGGPLTLLESMALGLVPVCGDIPALVQDVVTFDNGFRVPRADADAYAERISKLDADRNLLERMSGAARKTITETFSNESMARRYAKLFDSLAKTNASRVWPEKITPVGLSGMTSILSSPLGRSLRRIGKRLRALGFP
jgi:glycosyltransferase involved in cell wall biosynthesis